MPITDIKEIRILPPLAIARFGSSPEPMESYQLSHTAGGTANWDIEPDYTIYLDDDAVGRIEKPVDIKFRDAQDNIKPVAPFFEVWGLFEGNEEFRPVRKDDLGPDGTIEWEVTVANWKIFRRTGLQQDKIVATSGSITDHTVHNLDGACANFLQLPGKVIPFGSAQFIRPTTEFPELRLRITPPMGRVYGHRLDSTAIFDTNQVVYDAGRGRWDLYPENAPGEPPMDYPRGTTPGGIYAQIPPGSGDNAGYLDDSSDGMIAVTLNGQDLNSPIKGIARIAIGPPDFVPDARHVRTLQDDMVQAANGVEIDPGDVTPDDVIDIVARAVDTVRHMYPVRMVSNYSRTTGRPPAYNPSSISYSMTVNAHQALMTTLEGLRRPLDTEQFKDALDEVESIVGRLRGHTEVSDTDQATKMPAIMRGSDSFDLALTRRQVRMLEVFYSKHTSPVPGPTTPLPSPEESMLTLIQELTDKWNATVFHNHLPGSNTGESLGDLFADPNRILDFLKTGKSTMDGFEGMGFVVPKDPERSAFYKLIDGSNAMMTSRFRSYRENGTERTGNIIVRAWIMSLA